MRVITAQARWVPAARAARHRVQPPGPAPRPTALYRYFDEGDRLLYVGIALDLAVREGGHIKRSTWMDFAARSTIDRYPSRPDALNAERAAIRAEQPLFNVQHNETADAAARLRAYLTERDRPDLLPFVDLHWARYELA